MTPDIADLTAFVAVVETGSITHAAERLDLAKSVVSKRIATLEARLATRLLTRTTRRTAPTDAGALFYERARSILAQLTEATEEVAAQACDLAGQIRMAAPMSFGMRHLGRMLAAFMAEHPRIELLLDLDDRHVDLVGGGYDLSLRIGRLPDSTLKARALGKSRRAVVASPEYLARRGRPARIEDLVDHDCLGYANIGAQLWRFQSIDDPTEQRTLELRGRFGANNGDVILDVAAAGLGIAIMPRFMTCDALRAGRLVALAFPGFEPVADPIHVVYPATRYQSRRIRALIEFLAREIRDPAPWDV